MLLIESDFPTNCVIFFVASNLLCFYVEKSCPNCPRFNLLLFIDCPLTLNIFKFRLLAKKKNSFTTEDRNPSPCFGRIDCSIGSNKEKSCLR